MEHDAGEVTRILEEGGGDAVGRLLPLLYEDLRVIAVARLREERAGHTLQPTALVHESYLRLVGDHEIAWRGRGHFFAAAAEAMRRILVEHARKHRARKRGGGRRAIPLDVATLVDEGGTDALLEVDDALSALEAEDPRAAQLIKLRFYGGLSVEDAARALDLSPRTAARDWAFARARLHELLALEAPTEGGEP